MSGLYFFGSGERQSTFYGVDLRNGPRRRRGSTAFVPMARSFRNYFVGDPIHRVDMRLQQRIPLGRVSIDGLFEVFNLFDRANFGAWETEESSGSFGEPLQNANLAYAPRTLQLGFRVASRRQCHVVRVMGPGWVFLPGPTHVRNEGAPVRGSRRVGVQTGL